RSRRRERAVRPRARAFHLRTRDTARVRRLHAAGLRGALRGAWVRREWHGRHGRRQRHVLHERMVPRDRLSARARADPAEPAARAGLPERPVVPRLEDAPSLVMNRAPGTMLDVVISTAEGQTGVASGALRRSWDEDGRSF